MQCHRWVIDVDSFLVSFVSGFGMWLVVWIRWKMAGVSLVADGGRCKEKS